MFHVVVSIASRFLFLRNVLHEFARGILALRNLHAISSHLTLSLSPPPPIPLLDAPTACVEETISHYLSAELIAIESQSPVFSSPISSYQSSLITIMPSQLPNLVPLFIILAIISGFILVILPDIVCLSTNIAKISSAFTRMPSNFAQSFRITPFSHLVPNCLIFLFSLILVWTGPPAIAFFFSLIWVMSLLLSCEQCSNVIVTTLERCGILTARDTRTPPVLDAIYEQIIHCASGSDNLIRGSDLSDKYNMEQTNHFYAEFIDSQNTLHRQLQVERSREQKLHADLAATQRECKKLRAFVTTLESSEKKRREWKELAVTAKSRCAEAEVTAFLLRADLTAAMDRTRTLQEQLDQQTELVSDKDYIIQSFNAEFKGAEDEITRLNAQARHEHDERLRETKELLDEQVRMRDRHDAEIHRLTQEALDTQQQLEALRDVLARLRDHGQPWPDDAHSPLHRLPTMEPVDTGQPPLPPEPYLDTGTPPVGPSGNPDSSLCFTKSSQRSSSHDQADCFPGMAARLLPSDVAEAQQAAPRDLFESPQDVKPSGPEERRLEEELTVTKEKLRLTEEEGIVLLRDLDQSRETLREVETLARNLKYELDMCQTRLREEQDTQQSVAELLRLRSSELESSKAEAESSQFQCSQVTLLSAALQERVSELEADVQKLKSISPVHTDSRSISPSDTVVDAIAPKSDLQASDSIYITVSSSLPWLLDLPLPPSSSQSSDSSLYLDRQSSSAIIPACIDSHSYFPADTDSEAIIPNALSNSIYMTLPSSMSLLLDSSLPPSSSQTSDSSLYISRSEVLLPTAEVLNSANHDDLFLTRHPPPPLFLERLTLPPFSLPRTFLSERDSIGSVDRQLIGSGLSPVGENVRQDDGVGVQTKENANDSNHHHRTTPLSPPKDLEEILSGHAPPVSSIVSFTPLDCSLAHFLDKQPVARDDDLNTQHWSRPNNTFGILTPISPPFSAHPDNDCRVDNFVTPTHEEIARSSHLDSGGIFNISTSLASRDALVGLSHVSPTNIALPVFPKFVLPPFSLPPSGFPKALEPQTTPSAPRNHCGDTLIVTAPTDWEQCDQEACQDVARLKVQILTSESAMTNAMLLSETQPILRISEEPNLRQQESLSLELETCAKQRDHWKAVAEQAETKMLDADRTMLDIRKELAIALKNAREAKEQFQSQTVVLGERDAMIRFLDRELVEVRDELQDAKDEMDGLRSDLERTEVWKPLDPVDGSRLARPVLEWCAWLTPDEPAMPARRPRTPDMSISELTSVSCRPPLQGSPSPSAEILSYSTHSIVHHTDPHDPFLVKAPCTQPPFASWEVTTPFTTYGSLLSRNEIIELREQLAHEKLTRAYVEDQ